MEERKDEFVVETYSLSYRKATSPNPGVMRQEPVRFEGGRINVMFEADQLGSFCVISSEHLPNEQGVVDNVRPFPRICLIRQNARILGRGPKYQVVTSTGYKLEFVLRNPDVDVDKMRAMITTLKEWRILSTVKEDADSRCL